MGEDKREGNNKERKKGKEEISKKR